MKWYGVQLKIDLFLLHDFDPSNFKWTQLVEYC